jgi:hypothetical protein
MKKFGGVILTLGLILTMGTAALADGFQMDKVTIATRQVEDEDAQNWIYFNSNAKYDWMRMNLQGKLYVPQLTENWIDYSRDGLDDLYSGLRANFRFPEFSRGLDANLGYKWNKNYRIYLYGVGYGWSPAKNLALGLHYDAANRSLTSSSAAGSSSNANAETGAVDNDEDTAGDLRRSQEEFTLEYRPKGWGYALTAQRIDCDYPDGDKSNLLKYVLNQKLDWQATSKIDLGLRYVTKSSEYYNNASWSDGDSNRLTLDGSLKWNPYWTWSSAYTQADYSGHDGDADSNGWNIKAKYTPADNWWAAAKLYIYDLNYDYTYWNNNRDDSDIDDDYNSRTQQVVAVEYEQKLDAFTYNLELFVKNYAYKSNLGHVIKPYEDGAKVGIIGAIAWDWVNWHWVFRAAPNGDLTTRKANYELKATYKF